MSTRINHDWTIEKKNRIQLSNLIKLYLKNRKITSVNGHDANPTLVRDALVLRTSRYVP